MVTEAGFGADIGMEKFFNIKASLFYITPTAVLAHTALHVILLTFVLGLCLDATAAKRAGRGSQALVRRCCAPSESARVCVCVVHGVHKVFRCFPAGVGDVLLLLCL